MSGRPSVRFTDDEPEEWATEEPTTWEEVEMEEDELQQQLASESEQTLKGSEEGASPHRDAMARASALDQTDYSDPLGLGSRVRGVATRLSAGNRSRAMSTGLRRWRSLRSMGLNEGSTATIHNFLESFQPQLFLVQVHGNTTYADLQAGAQNLLENMRSRDEQLKALVKGSLDRFIDCKDAIDSVYMDLLDGPLSLKFGPNSVDMPQQLEASVQALQDQFDRIWGSILSRQVDIESKRRVLAVLQRFQFLVGLPRQLKDSIARGEHDRVVRHYKRAKALSVLSKVTLFQKILEEVDHMVATFRQTLFASLENARTPQQDQEKTIKLLVELDAAEDPAWHYLRFKHTWVKRQLVRAYHEHTEKQRSMRQALRLKARSERKWRRTNAGSATPTDTPQQPESIASPSSGINLTVLPSVPPPATTRVPDRRTAVSMKLKRASMSFAALRPPKIRRGHKRAPSNPLDRVRAEEGVAAADIDSAPSPVASTTRTSSSSGGGGAEEENGEADVVSEELTALQQGRYVGFLVRALSGVLSGFFPDFWELVQDVVRGKYRKIDGVDVKARDMVRDIFSLYASIVRRCFFGPVSEEVTVSSIPPTSPGTPSLEVQMDTAADVYAEPCSQKYMRDPVSEIAAIYDALAPLAIPEDHRSDLQELFLDVTSSFIVSTTNSIKRRVADLADQEDWVIQEHSSVHAGPPVDDDDGDGDMEEPDFDFPGHMTVVPDSFHSMGQDMLKQICGVLPTHSTDSSSFLRLLHDAFFGLVAGFADTLHHIAFNGCGEGTDTQGPRLLTVMANLHYTRRVVLPSLFRVFKTEFVRLDQSSSGGGGGGWGAVFSEISGVPKPSACMEQLSTLMSDLETMIRSQYIRVETVRLASVARHGILLSGCDWTEMDSVVGLRPYMLELLVLLTRSHNHIIRINGIAPLRAIFCKLASNLLSVMAAAFGRIHEFGPSGVLQARAEVEFIAHAMDKFATRESRRAVQDTLWWVLHRHPLLSESVSDQDAPHHPCASSWCFY